MTEPAQPIEIDPAVVKAAAILTNWRARADEATTNGYQFMLIVTPAMIELIAAVDTLLRAAYLNGPR